MSFRALASNDGPQTFVPSTNRNPLVSVILPVFNGEGFVGQALHSALCQTYGNLEIIVVDDGSTDGTRAVVEACARDDARVRLITQANAGVARARNRAIAESHGEFIAPLDADDLWEPSKIERQVHRMLEAGGQTGLVYAWWVWIDREGAVLDRSPRWIIEGEALEMLLRVVFIGNASVPLFRRSCLVEAGGYNETLAAAGAGGCEDWEAALRVASRYRVAVVPRVLVGYRRRKGSMSTSWDTMWRSREHVLRSMQQLRPDLDPAIFRLSSKQFALYLAGLAFWSGNIPSTIRWGLRAGFRLPLLIFPYAVKLLWKRLLPTPKSVQIMLPGAALDPSRIPDPLVPYNRLYRHWIGAIAHSQEDPASPSGRPDWLLTNEVEKAGAARFIVVLFGCAALVVHRLLLARMRAEEYLSRFSKGPRRPRVLAMACWHFPIYSQTFVYREILSLASHGFDVRFAYSGLASRRQLPSESAPLWRLKRRLVVSGIAAALDLEHYKRRMPDQVEQLAMLVGEASGLTVAEVLAHRHFRHAFSFTRMAEVWKADYIHTYFFYEATLFGLVARYLLGIPRGVSCYADHMIDDYDLKMVALHLRSCEVLVATSSRIKDELEALAQLSLPAAIVKPNGIDAAQFNVEERPPSREGRTLRLVSVSRIHPKKGLATLMEGALLLCDANLPFVVEILGEPDAHDPPAQLHYKELKSFVAAHQLGDVVKFRGRKTALEVRRFLAEADVFVAPFVELPNGDKDGIPTALLEAMAAGCTILSTDAGSILEAVQDEVEGLIVPQFDPTALAQAILRLAGDDRLRARLSRAAIDRVHREFDVSHCEAVFHERVRAATASRRGGQVEVAPA